MMLKAAAPLKPRLARDHFTLFTVIFALAVLAVSHAAGQWSMAVYALSFWHYVVYALAFFWRQIPLKRFKYDAVLLKSMSLAAFGIVFLSSGPTLLSLVVIAAGLALNIAAARALGTDRTYFGVELAGLPFERMTRFPYSFLSHPMLVGNMVAFGGTLLDGEFRQFWWPLALLHVGLNFLVLVMEVYGRRSHLAGVLLPSTGLALASIMLVIGFIDVWQFAVTTVVMGLAFAALLFHRYAKAADNHDERRSSHE